MTALACKELLFCYVSALFAPSELVRYLFYSGGYSMSLPSGMLQLPSYILAFIQVVQYEERLGIVFLTYQILYQSRLWEMVAVLHLPRTAQIQSFTRLNMDVKNIYIPNSSASLPANGNNSYMLPFCLSDENGGLCCQRYFLLPFPLLLLRQGKLHHF